MYIDENRIEKILKSLKIKFSIWAFFIVTSVYGIISGFLGNEDLADSMDTYIQLTVIFSILAFFNFRKSNLIKSAYIYSNIFKNTAYGHIDLSELSSKLNKTTANVTKDIEKLLKLKVLKNLSIELGDIQKVVLMKETESDGIEYENLDCPYCGARIKKRAGFMSKCQYCDGEIS